MLGVEEEHIWRAAQTIKRGGIVVYPTESFYGIGADATNEDAVKRVFKIKKRRENNPILLIIGKKDMLYPLVNNIPDNAQRLINRFWPGALTIIFNASKNILPILSGGTGKIGVRISGNAVARRLAELSGVPITGTSANISGRPPCRSADEVIGELKGIDMVLDAGILDAEMGTTVIDITGRPPKVLRKGLIAERILRECIGEIDHA